MATTVDTVFKLAMNLIDEITDAGLVNTQNTNNYKAKTPAILSILEAELMVLEGIELPAMLTAVTDNVHVSDRTARLVLPYGLAAQLLLVEDRNTASFFQQRYEELKRRIPRSFVAITDVYEAGENI